MLWELPLTYPTQCYKKIWLPPKRQFPLEHSPKLVYIDFDRSLIVSLKIIIIFIHLESVLLELKD